METIFFLAVSPRTILMADLGTEKYSASSSMTARFAFPSYAGACTDTWYSLGLNCLMLSFFAWGLTETEIVNGMTIHCYLRLS